MADTLIANALAGLKAKLTPSRPDLGDLPAVPPRPVWNPYVTTSRQWPEAENFPPNTRGEGDSPLQFLDKRAVPPTQRLNAKVPSYKVKHAVSSSLAAGIDPTIALAMMVQEGEYWPRNAEAGFETVTSLKEHAARVPGAPLERQLQAWNGLGKPRYYPNKYWYGGKTLDELGPNYYGNRVLDVRQGVVEQTPEIQQIIAQEQRRPHQMLDPKFLALLPHNARAIQSLIGSSRVKNTLK